MLKRRTDGVRRGQLKLRVREDEISVVRILSKITKEMAFLLSSLKTRIRSSLYSQLVLKHHAGTRRV